MVRVNTSGKKSEADLQQGNRLPPGFHHVVVGTVDESLDKGEKIIIKFDGLTAEDKGLSITEYLSLSDKAADRLALLALVLGLAQPDQDDQDISFTAGVGRQLVVKVEEHEYEKDGQKKKGTRVAFTGFWSTDSPDVAAVPKNQEWYAVYVSSKGNGWQAGGAAASGGTAKSGGDAGDGWDV